MLSFRRIRTAIHQGELSLAHQPRDDSGMTQPYAGDYQSD